MSFKSRLMIWMVIICLFSAFVISIGGCGNKPRNIWTDLSPLSINTYTQREHAIYGESITVSAVCEPELMGPDKPVFIWEISHNGKSISEIVHNTKPQEKSKVTDNISQYSFGDNEDKEKYSWPNYDTLDFTLNEIGTYIFKTTLYEFDEYSRDGKNAPVISSDSLTIYCDTIKLSIEAKPTPNSREYLFTAKVENPEFLAWACPVKWDFMDVNDGQTDSGLTEEVSI